MKKLFFLSVITIAVLLIASQNFYAQGCHGDGGNSEHGSHSESNATISSDVNHYAMNGGVVQKVGKYNIEMVYQPLAQDPITFYLMNKKGKPISNHEITGKAEIIYSDKNAETITLKPGENNGLTGPTLNNPGSFICFVTLQINGKNVTARFDGGATGKEIGSVLSGYTCPMHPEVQSANPDSCPKCGMALVKMKK